MHVRIENPDGEKRVDEIITNHPVRIDTGEGTIIVGVFNGDVQVVRVTGDKATTMIKFNDRSLL